jgi:hypothetical protein
MSCGDVEAYESWRGKHKRNRFIEKQPLIDGKTLKNRKIKVLLCFKKGIVNLE